MQKVTINGVEYTPFEKDKTAEQLGIDTSRKFIVVEQTDKFYKFKVGSIVEIKRINEIAGEVAYITDGNLEDAYYFYKLAYYDEEHTKFKVWGANNMMRAHMGIDPSISVVNPDKHPWGKLMPDGKVHWGKDVDSIIKQYQNYKFPKSEPCVGKGNKIMSNIVTFFNDLTVSAEDKELRKAGLKDSELNWTDDAINIVTDLEAKERGYKNYHELQVKVGGESSRGTISVLEGEALFTKFYSKLLDTAKKFNKKNDKK